MTLHPVRPGWLGVMLVLGAAGPVAAQGEKPAKGDRNRVVRAELIEAAETFSNLYDALKFLRPHFLKPSSRSRTGSEDPTNSFGAGSGYISNLAPVVYLDGRKLGDLGALRDLRTRDIEEARYISPTTAAAQYGMGHEGGVIAVKRVTGTP